MQATAAAIIINGKKHLFCGFRKGFPASANTCCRFVRIFGTRKQTDMRPKGHWSPAPAGRVFRGQKISGLLFKISGSDFKIRATNFFFAPMQGKHTENQFSFSRPQECRFSVPVFRRPMSSVVTRTARLRWRILRSARGRQEHEDVNICFSVAVSACSL